MAKSKETKPAELAETPATAAAAVELQPAVEVALTKQCGGLAEATVLARVELRKGVELNFAVDAVRSGIARALEPAAE